KELEILVLDEADTMLDMGFIHDIKRILKLIPAKRQTLLFSATFAPDVMALAETVTNNPVKLSVTPQNSTVEVIEQKLVAVDKQQKIPALIALLKQNDAKQTLVFARTKHGADKVVRKLSGAGIRSAAIHGNKSQGARTKALSALKDGTIQVLVATDIAARGIDIDRLPAVINLDLPNVPANYVHRIGRTGRAGEGGRAWSLVCADEVAELRDIESFIKQNIPRESLEGFELSEPLPTHPVKIKAATVKKPKKPKKPREGQAARRRSGAPKRSGNKPRSEGKAPPPSSKGAWANAGSRA
ncbi:MAG: DEAD/DEAH box helicase, partial [Aestuariibacter sp.]|nr:DEAD/DEAH box helicase [Aestuariibacter sp.]